MHPRLKNWIKTSKKPSKSEFIAKLRRLADCLETDQPSEIQIAKERIYLSI